MFVQADDAALRHSDGFLPRRTGPVDAMDHGRETIELVLGNATGELELLQGIDGPHVGFLDEFVDVR